ncbi:MAG TPA: AraC family transcriptional regulator [Amaricoccus sp.]|uniref:AraC family transcriptional regulator n=1 Tax=Amaricoccus sp. TaxID=1872485 RepID=UPI002C041DE2|nr:AraC family transcriptional regulator [Amaricoccus sp.]HMQ95290.1 AraC family transcriptional regulator [Amaricoccus sp.]HMR52908.1 AraC family transcriptional regulator [Amaricoccus sp.]HMR60900.1 AraC family transcriptional regulator [Amaricoccus sp.]HMT97758.1 AraC family transcriptional regulator [Amaricoccus sp.]
MTEGHDRMSGSPARSSGEVAPPARAGGQDPLSDVLRNVRLGGALFFLVDATAPWCVDVPESEAYRAILFRRARHLISYHIAVEGSGFASVPGGKPMAFDTGDILVIPHGDAYRIESAPGTVPEFDREGTLQFFREMAAGRLPFVVREGGGGDPPARFVCGFLGCDSRPFNPLLTQLPRLLRIRRRAGGADLLDRLVDLTLAEMRRERTGGTSLRLGLSELLFIEAIRRHLEALPEGETGWLAGLRDPGVGRALAALHARPQAAWTLGDLAREAGLSRSVLAARFAALVGLPPMQYLARWRMQRAARLLADGDARVGAVAFEVGYGSEAAFSRGFKRMVGVSPAEWRRAAETG